MSGRVRGRTNINETMNRIYVKGKKAKMVEEEIESVKMHRDVLNMKKERNETILKATQIREKGNN